MVVSAREWFYDLREAAESPRVAPFLNIAAVVGFLVAAAILLGRGTVETGGDGGGDAAAYWRAGHAILDGTSPYGRGVGEWFSYLYPPVFAQLIAPLSALPFVVFLWLWRAAELACLRYIVGSWRAVGISLIAWLPLLVEIDNGNVHLFIAAAVVLAIHSDGRSLGLVALSKFAALAAFPVAWQRDRRGVLLGLALAGSLAATSVAASPQMWSDYIIFLGQAQEPTGWYNVGSFIWTPLRLAVALALALAAWRWPRLAVPAVTLALPVLWLHGLSILIGLVASPDERRRSVEARAAKRAPNDVDSTTVASKDRA